MRISPAALAVLLAFTVPIVVELRTVLAWVGIEVTVVESLLVGAVMVVAVLAWAFWPDHDGSESPS